MARTGAAHRIDQATASEPAAASGVEEVTSNKTLDAEVAIALTTALDMALDHQLGPLDEAAALKRELQRLGIRQTVQ